MFVPSDQRKWNDILAVDYINKGSLSFGVSKTMTRIIRHRGLHQETDGAMDWGILLPMLCRDYGNALRWTNHEWLDHLRKGSDKNRFQYCLNSDGFIHYMRAIQGHSAGNKVDPSLVDRVEKPCMGSEYIYHVGSSLCLHSIPLWIGCRRKRCKRWKTNSILHCRGSYDRFP